MVDVFVVYGATETKADAEYDAMAKMANSSDWGDMVSLVVGAIMTVKELAYYGINGAEEAAFEIFLLWWFKFMY